MAAINEVLDLDCYPSKTIVKYDHHPLRQVSEGVEKVPMPQTDATPENFERLFRPGFGQRLKAEIGNLLYPLKNQVERQWVIKQLRQVGVAPAQLARPNVISWGNKGFGTAIFLQRIAATLGQVETIASFGCGMGQECLWIAKYLRPKQIVGCDYFNYQRAWDYVAQQAASQYGVKVTFHQMDLRNPLPVNFTKADLLISISVLEHLRDFGPSLVLLKTLLKPGGHFASLWGPMWYSYSGDHIASELGLAKAYEHVLLAPEAYLEFYRAHPRNREDVRRGIPTWLELGLHNFARYDEYIALVEQIYGQPKFLQWCVCPDAFRYKKTFLTNWHLALEQNQLTPLDLVLTQASIIV